MKLRFPYLLPGEQAIESMAEYLEIRHNLDELDRRVRDLMLEINHQHGRVKIPHPTLLQELESVRSEAHRVRYAFYRRQPVVLGARCPYCDIPIWLRVGVFSLADEFWYRDESNGRKEALEESRCPHLFCVDGALNLNGYQPTEAHKPLTMASSHAGIVMASEVPFVKPRVLNLPTLLAVIHSFPVAQQYTAYPIVYFAERMPDQMDFCIAWARTAYVERHQPSGSVLTAKRTDAQDYDLGPWIRQGKVFGLDVANQDLPLVRGTADAFPYAHVVGRRHPYVIQDGQVFDLPDPMTTKPIYYVEDPF